MTMMHSGTDQNLSYTLHWRHNGHDTVSNHQLHHCLLNRLFRRRSKKISKLRVTGLCVSGEFPAQMASNAENVSIWWRHREFRSPASRQGRKSPAVVSLDDTKCIVAELSHENNS